MKFPVKILNIILQFMLLCSAGFISQPLFAATNPANRIPELSSQIEKAITELEQISNAEPSPNAEERAASFDPLMGKKLEDLADRLEEVADDLDDMNRFGKSKSKKWFCYMHSYHSTCNTEKRSQAEIDEALRAKWLVYGLTFRGALSNATKFHEQLGAEIGLGLPLWNGVDIGMGFGNLFRDGGQIVSDIRARIFLNSLRRGLYIGGGYVLEEKNKSYGAVGLQGGAVFAELDMIRDKEKPLALIPQFGLRFRR